METSLRPHALAAAAASGFDMNFDAIVGGKVRDIVLEPQDIIWVPNSPFERIDQYLGQVISSFMRTVAANEGARAAVPGAATVQPTVGIGN